MSDDIVDLNVKRFTNRAHEAAGEILLEAFPDGTPVAFDESTAAKLVAAGFARGKQEGLAESRLVIEDLQRNLDELLKMFKRAL